MFTEEPEHVSIHIGESPVDTEIKVGGKPVEGVYGFTLTAHVDEVPRLTIEYGCYQHVTIEGQVETHHLCPIGSQRRKS